MALEAYKPESTKSDLTTKTSDKDTEKKTDSLSDPQVLPTATNLKPGINSVEIATILGGVEVLVMNLPDDKLDSELKEMNKSLKDNSKPQMSSWLQCQINMAETNGTLKEFCQSFNNRAQRQNLPFRLEEIGPQNGQPGQKGVQLIDDTFKQPYFRLMLNQPPKDTEGGARTNVLVHDTLPENVKDFLRRAEKGSESDKVSSQEQKIRQEAIEALETSGADPQLVNELKAVHLLRQLQYSKTDKLAAKELKSLIELKNQGSVEASSYLDQLTAKLKNPENKTEAKDLESLLKLLGKSDDSSSLELLKSGLPPGDERINQLRTKMIVQDLGENPSDDLLRRTLQNLESEVLCGNDQAKDWRDRLTADDHLLDLNRPGSERKAIRQLVKEMENGNKYARDALVALLIPEQHSKLWQSRFASQSEYKIKNLPPLSKLSKERQQFVKEIAAAGLQETIKNTKTISRSEASALALCLLEAADPESGNSKLTASINSIFQGNDSKIDLLKDRTQERLSAKRAENILGGLFDVITKSDIGGKPGQNALLKQYAIQASSTSNRYVCDDGGRGKDNIFNDVGLEFSRQVEEFFSLAAKGDRNAISILCAITGGAGKENSKANLFVGTDHGRQTTTALARRSQNQLTDIAKADPKLRKVIMEELTSTLQTKDLPDKSNKYETLAKIAALVPQDIPDNVRETLRSGVENKDTREYALAGMISLADAMNSGDMRTFAKHLTPAAIENLKQSAHKLSPFKGAQLCDVLAKNASDPFLVNTIEQREMAIKGLAALGPLHATKGSIAAIESFGGIFGKQMVMEQFKVSPRLNDRDRESAAERIQKAAALCLLDIAEKSPSTGRKTDAFTAFSSKFWGEESSKAFTQEYSGFRNRLIGLARANPDNITIQAGVQKLVAVDKGMIGRGGWSPGEGCSDTTKLAVALKNKGMSGSDETLEKLSKELVEKYGAKESQLLIDRIALFNALPPAVKQRLTAIDKLDEGQSLRLHGKTLSAETFNKLPPEVRNTIVGHTKLLEKDQTVSNELEGKSISAEVFNSLSTELRKELNSGS